MSSREVRFKRRKLDVSTTERAREAETEGSDSLQTAENLNNTVVLPSLDRAISPPPGSRQPNVVRLKEPLVLNQNDGGSPAEVEEETTRDDANSAVVASPFQLTRIRDLPPECNVDTVSLQDLLGNPMIKEAWLFNYLFDIEFILNAFDSDVRDLIQVKIIHGFANSQDDRKSRLEVEAKPFPNVELIAARMPEMFGTHHSKMMVLVYHDDHAQVIIHTANMIERDWRNMCQAVWKSPLLPLLPDADATSVPGSRPLGSGQPFKAAPASKLDSYPLGCGQRFKADLLAYIHAYASKLFELRRLLARFDFSSVRGAFIASVPGSQYIDGPNKGAWGWLKLRDILSNVPCKATKNRDHPTIVIQMSSIATLGATDRWLANFLAVLQTAKGSEPAVLKFKPKKSSSKSAATHSTAQIIFPTPSEIRACLDGYAAGASIHTKLQSDTQQKQLQYLRPMLCKWSSEHGSQTRATSKPSIRAFFSPGKTPALQSEPVQLNTSARPSEDHRRAAGRNRAAPHIKTYVRFSDSSCRSIDWALLTSANLSTQAWGNMPAKEDAMVRTASYEVGVLVWPDLWADCESEDWSEPAQTEMLPTFMKDTPNMKSSQPTQTDEKGQGKSHVQVGFRMPYDLPLMRYTADDEPWCVSAAYEEPDWKGMAWAGYGNER